MLRATRSDRDFPPNKLGLAASDAFQLYRAALGGLDFQGLSVEQSWLIAQMHAGDVSCSSTLLVESKNRPHERGLGKWGGDTRLLRTVLLSGRSSARTA
jgi:hypothetical protein